MKTTSLHIAFAALLSLLLLASCSRNDEVAVAEGEEGKVYVTLTLSINGEEAGSRATWEDNDNPEDGNEWENTIDDLQILIYDANNNYVGKVEDLIQLLDGRYSGTLSSDAEWTGNTNYKIMAFANCPSIDDPSNISTLDYTRANVSYIPMWGVTTTTFDLTPGESDDIGSIDLLRAMAKVEVFMDAEGYTIDNISVDKKAIRKDIVCPRDIIRYLKQISWTWKEKHLPLSTPILLELQNQKQKTDNITSTCPSTTTVQIQPRYKLQSTANHTN